MCPYLILLLNLLCFCKITGHHVVSYVVEYKGMQILWYFATVQKILNLHNLLYE